MPLVDVKKSADILKVSATSVLLDGYVLVGDGGTRNVKSSGVSIDSSSNITTGGRIKLNDTIGTQYQVWAEADSSAEYDNMKVQRVYNQTVITNGDPYATIVQFRSPENSSVMSSVALSTDIVTMASPHLFNTGARVIIQNSGGAVPAGLSANTIYWVRAVDESRLRFYTNETDAQNDTNRIDITDSGSGTNTVYLSDQEATISLKRLRGTANEFMDLYANGYDGSDQFGIRVQKRGTGSTMRDFVLDTDDGTTQTEFLRANVTTSQLDLRSTTITVANAANDVGLTVTQNDTTNNPRAVSLVNAGTANSLFVDANGTTSASTSVGGAILLENTGNGGAGMIIYSNFGSGATGRLLNIRADNAAFDQDVVHIDNDGVGDALSVTGTAAGSNAITATSSGVDHTLAISYTGSTANKGAASFSSTNGYTTVNITDVATGQGALKITHTGTGSDANASGISIDLAGSGTAAQGIFIDSTGGGSTGKLLNLRNNGTEKFTVSSEGGLVCSRVILIKTQADSPYTLSLADANKVLTNEGATGSVTFSLPTAVAGLTYSFVVQDADGIVVDADSGDTIRVADSVSAASGNATSTTIGSALTLVAINATEWVATESLGTWVLT